MLSYGNALANKNEIRQFAESLQSIDPLERITALKMIAKYGSSDESLFALINNLILKEVAGGYAFDETAANRQTMRIGGASSHATYFDELAWMCETLAYSGFSPYRSTLKQVYETAPAAGKLKRYAEQTLNKLDKYEKIIQCTTGTRSNIDHESARYICMIEAEPINIKKNGALHIYWSLELDNQVYKTLKTELLKNLALIEKQNPVDSFADDGVVADKHLVDCLAWMCKALASSGQAEYQATLTAVTSKARKLGLYKLADHARRSNALIPQIIKAYATREAVENSFGNLMPAAIKSICLVKSNNLFLKSFGAQHIYWSERKNVQITDVVEKELLTLNEIYYSPGAENYGIYNNISTSSKKRPKITRDTINSMIWLCKVLGASGNKKYLSTLKKIDSSNQPHTRLKHVLKKYIN